MTEAAFAVLPNTILRTARKGAPLKPPLADQALAKRNRLYILSGRRVEDFWITYPIR